MTATHLSKIEHVQQQIQQASKRANRADDVTLVAVSKTKPISAIIAAYEAGIRHFGENRAQELAEKAQQLQYLTDLQWHFIGHLQTRQSLPVATYARYFHAVDRVKIAERLSRQLQQSQRSLDVFIQVNISGEASKSGFNVADWENTPQQGQTLVQAMLEINTLANINVIGLMTMAPWSAPKAEIRTLFQRLQTLSNWVNKTHPELQATKLSMGMSGDFELAVEKGATHVRVGSAIFGQRE